MRRKRFAIKHFFRIYSDNYFPVYNGFRFHTFSLNSNLRRTRKFRFKSIFHFTENLYRKTNRDHYILFLLLFCYLPIRRGTTSVHVVDASIFLILGQANSESRRMEYEKTIFPFKCKFSRSM